MTANDIYLDELFIARDLLVRIRERLDLAAVESLEEHRSWTEAWRMWALTGGLRHLSDEYARIERERASN